MSTEPYASARPVFWIVGNGSQPCRHDLDYRQVAQPFEWTFTRHDLDRVLAIAERRRVGSPRRRRRRKSA